MASAKDRVKIWNSYFKLAWAEARQVYEDSTNKKVTKRFRPRGGSLSDRDLHVLGTLLLCNLAIEARVNHLIDELVDQGKLTSEEARGAQQLSTQLKWFLLPKLAGVNKKLSANSRPHQAIAEICALRNDLLHVRYTSFLRRTLPSPSKVLSLFEGFVEAMENMNVVLRRHKKPHQVILDLGGF